MNSNLLLRNRSVVRLLVGVPEGHEHIRARIETAAGDVITLQEATLAALCRAYMDVSTHPRRRAVELRSAPVEDRKDGFAVHQLIEVGGEEGAVRAELASPPPEQVSPMSPAAEDTGISHPAPDKAELVSAPADTTFPHSREQIEAARASRAATAADEEPDDLELDEPEQSVDDGPVFGDIPTLHSKPRSGKAAPSRPKTRGGRKKKKKRARK